jgi:hypothetical protein
MSDIEKLKKYVEDGEIKGKCGSKLYVLGSLPALKLFHEFFNLNLSLEYMSDEDFSKWDEPRYGVNILLSGEGGIADQQVEIIPMIHKMIGAVVWGGNWYTALMR